MKTVFYNLTPHEIRVLDDNDNEVALFISSTDTLIPRVNVSDLEVGTADINSFNKKVQIPINTVQFGEVENLPDPQEGVLLIVSAVIQSALPHRTDLAVPYPLVRNEKGQVIGCRGFSVNPKLR